MGLEPPPEVRQVLQTHPGDPRFQCRSETSQGGLSGEPGPSAATTSLLALGRGCSDLREKLDAGFEVLAQQARKLDKVPGSRGQKVALIIVISELTVGEGAAQGTTYLVSRYQGVGQGL